MSKSASERRTTTDRSGFAVAAKTTAPAEIAAQIRQALFDGKLKPGDRLGSERLLCQEFGVSRATIRDALRVLEASGIVEIKTGVSGGALIAQANPDRFADALAVQLKLVGVTEFEMIDAQLAVEVMATKLAAQNATNTDLAGLHEKYASLAGLLNAPDDFTRASFEFHLALVEASHNRALISQFKALQHLTWSAYSPHTNPQVAKRVLKVHGAVLDAIEAGDERKAAQLREANLESLRKELKIYRERVAPVQTTERKSGNSGSLLDFRAKAGG